MSQRGVKRLVSSDKEPLMSVGRDVVRVCATQIDDTSSRMIPSTVLATPATLARWEVHRALQMSSMFLRMIWHHIGWHTWKLGTGTFHHSFLSTRAMDRVVPCQSAVRWIDAR